MTNPNLAQWATVQKSNADAALALAQIAFNGMGDLTALGMAVSRDCLDCAASYARKTMGSANVVEFIAANKEVAKPEIDKWMDYSRSAYDVMSKMQHEATSILDDRYKRFTASAAKAAEKSTATMPLGGEVLASAIASMIEASNKAFDDMTSMAKQFSEIAESSFAASAKASAATPARQKKAA